jgi:hypothetical protein
LRQSKKLVGVEATDVSRQGKQVAPTPPP